MKIAIVTMFSDLRESYSVVQVVAEHIQMMLKQDIKVKLIVSDSCACCEKKGVYEDDRIEWVYISHENDKKKIKLYDYTMPNGKLHDTFEEEATFFGKQFVNALEDTSHCILHDILYIGNNYVYNIGIRQAQERCEEVKFIAFTHSFPVNRPIKLTEGLEGRYTPMPNTVYVYPSQSGLMPLSQQYHVPRGMCHTVYNSPSLIEGFCEEVKRLHQEVNLLESDLLIVYPGRLIEGKRHEKVVALAGCIKTFNEQSVKVVFCDALDSRTDGINYKKKIRKEGHQYGLNDGEIIFTSEHGNLDGFPHQGVLELFVLSNLFICPSYSEAFSLAVLEAASRGNFLVLNECVPALAEAGTMLNAYFMKWDARNYGYDTKQQYHPSELAYYEEHSRQIVNLMRDDRVCYAKTIVRQRLNSEWIWENQLKPLLEG